MFSDQHAFQHLKPKVFKYFHNIRCAVDCTEFFCEVPQNYLQQGNVYSSYKHHTTMKCLIAVNPNEAACFISDLFEGSIDDVTLFNQCGIMNYISYDDSLLVDIGFILRDLVLAQLARVFIPPFLGKQDSFTKEEVILTKKYREACIHVERFNERLKKFRLLDRTIPLCIYQYL